MRAEHLTPEQRRARIREIERTNHAAGLHTSRVESCEGCYLRGHADAMNEYGRPDSQMEDLIAALDERNVQSRRDLERHEQTLIREAMARLPGEPQ